MSYIIAGLGNPGEEYVNTRHNTGRIVLDYLYKKLSTKNGFSDWKEDKKLKALTSEAVFKKDKIILLMPNNFMNNSGQSLKPLITNKKKASELIVVYDDLDLPLGSFKISFNKGSGGHRGLESIIKNIKTKEFIRIRVGISPVASSGKLKKPKGEKEVVDFIIKDFKPAEIETLKKVSKKITESVESIFNDGLQKAMSLQNN